MERITEEKKEAELRHKRTVELEKLIYHCRGVSLTTVKQVADAFCSSICSGSSKRQIFRTMSGVGLRGEGVNTNHNWEGFCKVMLEAARVDKESQRKLRSDVAALIRDHQQSPDQNDTSPS